MNMSLDEGLVDFLYRWNRTESPNGMNIVDLDVLQKREEHPGKFGARDETRKALDALLDMSDDSTPMHPRQKVTGCDAYLSVLDGAELSLDAHVQRTMGVVPVMIDEAVLDAQRERNAALLGTLGFAHTREGVAAY